MYILKVSDNEPAKFDNHVQQTLYEECKCRIPTSNICNINIYINIYNIYICNCKMRFCTDFCGFFEHVIV
jgi:hypothetical protein